MESCSLFVTTQGQLICFIPTVLAVPGVGWGMHGGEELLSKSAGLDVPCPRCSTAPSPHVTSSVLKGFLNVSGVKGD